MKAAHLIVLIVTSTCLCSIAWASDFVDTRLSFVLADDNVLANSGETTPNSPSAGFGATNQNTQFYDNFNTKYSGFETLSNLTLYKMSQSFFEGVTTEASLSVLLLGLASGDFALKDNSSYLRVNWRPRSWEEKESVALTAFPVSADRFRLGYAYRISWGGNTAFSNNATADGSDPSQGSNKTPTPSIPGVKLQATRERWYTFAGMKTGQIANDLIHEKVRVYGFMLGGGIDLTSSLHFDANGGYFQKGVIPALAQIGVSAPTNAGGISSQLVYHQGEPVGTSVDLKLYKNDPDVYQKFFSPETYPGGLTYTVSIEGSFLTQSLADPSVSGKTKLQNAAAAAFQGRFKYNYWRFNFLAMVRSLSFILFDVPGQDYNDFPAGTLVQPEAFVAIGADRHFAKYHLTPGFIIGVQRPASYTSPQLNIGGNNPPAGLTGSRTVVVRDSNYSSALYPGSQVQAVISAKTNFKLDISEYFAAIGELYYTYDRNMPQYVHSTDGTFLPIHLDTKAHSLGFNAILQARF